MFDVIIVGGSYAGMSAALQLGRARRSVLVLDAGQRRNRFASSSHGFLGQDGVSPEVIAAKGKADVVAYPSVTWREAAVTDARPVPGGFAVREGSTEHRAKRVILATGVVDQLPAVPGLAERWGKSVFHCPYCHGYELGRRPLGSLATSPLSAHHASLVAEWAAPGQMKFFLQGVDVDSEQLAELTAREIRIERELVVAAEDSPEGVAVRLRDGRRIELAGLFVLPRTGVNEALASGLGCELEVGPTGSFYKTDPTKETTVPGVFACGDTSLAFSSVAIAVGDGALAGAAAHRSLVFRR
jgi:thioredoxin reductase